MYKLLLTLVAACFALSGIAQIYVINESFDAVTIPALPDGWTTTTNYDIGFRTEDSNVSDYGGASGLNNVVIRNTDSTGVYVFYSSVFSTLGLINLQMSWASRVSNNFLTPGSATPLLECSANGGVSWAPVTFTENANNSTWGVVNDSVAIALPAETFENPYVQLRWTASIVNDPSGTYRMDDVKVWGDANPTVTVRMRVNMSNEIVAPDGVFIAGNFNGWDTGSNTMTSIGGGIYEFQTEANHNSEIRFRFYNGAVSEIVPDSCGMEDGNDTGLGRFITVGTADTIYGPVCFNECSNCVIALPDSALVTLRVDMSQQIVSAGGVYAVGNFFGDTTQAGLMEDVGSGIYEYTALVEEGTELRYYFRNGQDQSNAELVPAACGVLDASGLYLRELFTGAEDTALDPVCYSECAACIQPYVSETFSDDLLLYPNPTNNRVWISSTEPINDVAIYDGTGRLVHRENNRSTKLELNLIDLPEGIYHVVAAQDKKTVTRTLLVNNKTTFN